MRDTRGRILEAARQSLLDAGYANLSTRRVAETAGVGLGHIHYHFGSKQNLILAVLEEENRRLLVRQREMYGADAPLWKQWEQACDYLEEDLESGYVRILQEMTAAGWSDSEIAEAVREILGGWFDLLVEVAGRTHDRIGGLGPFEPEEIAVLVSASFLGVESMVLLGVDEMRVPARAALRKVGALIRAAEDDHVIDEEEGRDARADS